MSTNVEITIKITINLRNHDYIRVVSEESMENTLYIKYTPW